MNYVRKLGFEENPDYDFLRELFSKVLKTLGEPEDGLFDWMLISNKPGWDGNVGFVTVQTMSSLISLASSQAPGAALAHLHANNSTPKTPQRGGREREREHGAHRRTSRQPQDGTTTPPPPLLISPSPARMKESGRRPTNGDWSRGDLSVQPLAPTSRRQSQQRDVSGALSPSPSQPHPYAATPSPKAFHRSDGTQALTPSSAINLGNGFSPINGSDPFLAQMAKGRDHCSEGVNGRAPRGELMVVDPHRMHQEGYDMDGHGERKGLKSWFCC
jgi:casein kinase 1